MKLFGNTGKGRGRRPAPGKKPEKASEAPRQDRVEFTTAAAPAPPPPVVSQEVRSADADRSAAAPRRRKSHFWLGFWLYVVLFLGLTAGGLYYLWQRLDVYEQSRPYGVVESWLAGSETGYWREMLRRFGVGGSYLDGLDLEQVDYYKKLDEYTEEAPVYGIRFGGKTMLIASLKPGEALDYGAHGWQIDRVRVVESHLAVYAPEGAAVTVNGQPIPADTPAQKDAQPLTLGPFEQDADLPGLTKYTLNWLFTPDGLEVTDQNGEALELAYSTGNSYYYPPLTRGYTVHAPSEMTVSLNDIVLTEENAEVTVQPLEAFEGLEDVMGELPEYRSYYVGGLIARPTVLARLSDGMAQDPVDETEESWTFSLVSDPGLRDQFSDYILKVFDAYIAYLGNRGSDLYGNYDRYVSYLLPGSEAADRAKRALDSIYWVKNRDTNPQSVVLGPILRYAEDCFTAQVDFTMAGSADSNGYLFIFLRRDGAWKVVRVLNTTSVI